MSSDLTSPSAAATTRHPSRDTTPHASQRSPDVVLRHRTLDGFVEVVSRADGIGLSEVDALATLVVRTDNSVYQITILQAYTREVIVKGGVFFPTHTRACLNGSSFGGSCLKLGWVGIGSHMEFHADDQWIITSHVRSINVEQSAAGAGSCGADVSGEEAG